MRTTLWCSNDTLGEAMAMLSPGRANVRTVSAKSWAKRSSGSTGWPRPEDEHERGVGGQLDVDVVGGAQFRGELVAGHARAAHVDDDPQRVPARDPGRPTRASPTTAIPGIASMASRARADAAMVRSSSASPCAAS